MLGILIIYIVASMNIESVITASALKPIIYSWWTITITLNILTTGEHYSSFLIFRPSAQFLSLQGLIIHRIRSKNSMLHPCQTSHLRLHSG